MVSFMGSLKGVGGGGVGGLNAHNKDLIRKYSPLPPSPPYPPFRIPMIHALTERLGIQVDGPLGTEPLACEVSVRA